MLIFGYYPNESTCTADLFILSIDQEMNETPLGSPSKIGGI